MDVKLRARVIRKIDLLEGFGIKLAKPHIKQIRGKIWELRLNGERILYFIFTGRKIVLLHAFTKKRQKLIKGDILIAEKRMEDFEGRYKK